MKLAKPDSAAKHRNGCLLGSRRYPETQNHERLRSVGKDKNPTDSQAVSKHLP